MADERNRDDGPTAAFPLALAGALALAFGLLTVAAKVSALAAAAALAPIAVVAVLFLRDRDRPIRPRARVGRAGPWPDQGLKAVTAALGTAAILTDGRGVVRYHNVEAATLFSNLLIGEPLAFGLRIPVILEALDRVMGGGEAVRVAWSQRVPTERWFEARVAPLAYPPRPDGRTEAVRPGFVLVTVEDLSERHRLERMRADFVANASHEMRTPLAAVSGFIETLQGPARDDAAARERFLVIMGDQTRRMRRLIDDLLSLSRVEMRAHVRPSETVDLAEIVTRTVTALAPIARDQDVTLALEGADAPLTLRGDADELAQVFSNLIENAIKYGGAGKTVTVRAGRAGPGAPISISVADEGPGIAAEHLPRLTERFYRVDVATSRSKQGTGLGLAIVKHIVTRHRGKLAITSSPGAGATFTVTFPPDAG